ncbi:MAG: glycosyltransferase family 4 protein, partial [Rhizobiales bacterium]|nr:glycosyltransferase family 4 protein [Hyphomicrobiales bacterium]
MTVNRQTGVAALGLRILFITDNFPPEVNAAATRTYEHAIEWVKAGAHVTVLTCAPNFPRGKLYPGYRNRLYSRETVEGIEVVRLWSYIAANEGFFKRVVDYVSFAMTAGIAGLFQPADVIVATSPQFFTTWAGQFLSVVVAVGAMKPGIALRTIERIELFLYRHAALVIPNTPALGADIVSRGVDPAKIHVITNGANLDAFRPRAKDPELVRELGVEGKFVVGYIGTHGMAHSLDFIVEAASTLPPDRLHFLFVGDGAEKTNVIRRASEVGLRNVTFVHPVQKEAVPAYISVTDASLVPLRRSDTFKTVIPSKIFESAAMQKPILLGVAGQAQGRRRGTTAPVGAAWHSRQPAARVRHLWRQPRRRRGTYPPAAPPAFAARA